MAQNGDDVHQLVASGAFYPGVVQVSEMKAIHDVIPPWSGPLQFYRISIILKITIKTRLPCVVYELREAVVNLGCQRQVAFRIKPKPG